MPVGKLGRVVKARKPSTEGVKGGRSQTLAEVTSSRSRESAEEEDARH